MRKNNEKGYTMMEVIGVLGIIGVLASSAAMLAGSVFDKYKMNRIMDQIVDLQRIISRRFMADGNYSGVENDALIKEKIIPKDMLRNNKIVHSYGSVILYPGTLSYRIAFRDLPYRACVQLGNLNWVIQDSSDLISININSKKFDWPEVAASKERALPIDIVRVGAACEHNDNNTIIWEFQ